MSEFIELPLSETDDLELKHKSLFFVPQYTFKKNKRCLVIIIPKNSFGFINCFERNKFNLMIIAITYICKVYTCIIRSNSTPLLLFGDPRLAT